MEGPKVIRVAYDFATWAIPAIAKLPRNKRYTLGEKIENKIFDLIDILLQAQYSREKSASLKQANLTIEQMRHLFRSWRCTA